MWWLFHKSVNVTKFYKIIYNKLCILKSFLGGSYGKESACNVGDLGLIPGSGRCPGKGNGSLPQYSCLENPTDRGARWDCSPRGRRVRHDCTTKHTCSPWDAHLSSSSNFEEPLNWSLSTSDDQPLRASSRLWASSSSFAELLKPPLHCTFVSSSWAKCIVDVVSCLCSFMKYFEL